MQGVSTLQDYKRYKKNHSWDIGSIHNEYSIILFKKSPKFKRESVCEREMDRCKRNWYERERERGG